ncbi:MAG: GntR family transcriptional regulator, partial [Muribaculaceae bacterium]|nr:GntR family transcriptional regulator [Muribaculaceae bacterium]
MEFNDNKPIYRQIIDHSFVMIMTGAWVPGERIPSVRELSSMLGVNSRTVLKA